MVEANFDRGGLTPPPCKASNIDEILAMCPPNKTIKDNYIRAWSIINNPKYEKIVCSISGGSDSDIMLDIIWRCDKESKVDYVWFNTGLEYQATKDHLKYLNARYGISIIEEKPIKSIPISCITYGQPFLSKMVSEMMQRLQRRDFEWEDEPFDVLCEKYNNSVSALRWWCDSKNDDKDSRFNISNNKYLKEFILQNPPTFRISNKCCSYAKKNVAHSFIKRGGYDLDCIGIRKSEGGARSTIYKNCFSEKGGSDVSEYRPIFWYFNSDKEDYEKAFGIVHSDCYTKYGLARTGCVGCPYNRKVFDELAVAEKYEPKLYKAVCNVFRDSYEYTKQYHEFVAMMREKERSK